MLPPTNKQEKIIQNKFPFYSPHIALFFRGNPSINVGCTDVGAEILVLFIWSQIELQDAAQRQTLLSIFKEFFPRQWNTERNHVVINTKAASYKYTQFVESTFNWFEMQNDKLEWYSQIGYYH